MRPDLLIASGCVTADDHRALCGYAVMTGPPYPVPWQMTCQAMASCGPSDPQDASAGQMPGQRIPASGAAEAIR